MESDLLEKIDADGYNATLTEINAKYAEMDKYIGNLSSDIQSVREFEQQVTRDRERGYDVGTSLDTLGFQKDSLTIDLEFFQHMKDVYIKKLYGDLYLYCDCIIEDALAIENIPPGFTREQVKERKFRGMHPYPPELVPNPAATLPDGSIADGEPAEIPDPAARYDMNGIFALINTTTSNLRELADDIGTFTDKITSAREKESRGFSVGNLIMNLESQKTKLTLEFEGYIERLGKFLQQNTEFSSRCLGRIKMISEEIVTTEEVEEAEDGAGE